MKISLFNKPTNSSWSLVSTVNENPEVLSIFINHYIALGCDELHLYFDNPADPSKLLYASNPKVLIRDSNCVAVSHERKQMMNAKDAYQNCRSEWLIHLDADELLYSEIGVAKILATIKSDVRQINIRPWEAVFPDFKSANLPFSTNLFRSALHPKELQDKYYPEAKMMLRRGFTGHCAGKCFIRKTTNDVCGGVHFWKDATSGECIPIHKLNSEIRLLHFDALSFPLWNDKLLRRIQGSVVMKGMDAHRLKQLEAFRDVHASGSTQAAEELFTRLYVFDPLRCDLLRSKGIIKMLSWRNYQVPPRSEIEITNKLSTLNGLMSDNCNSSKTNESALSSMQKSLALYTDGRPNEALDVLKNALNSEVLSIEPYSVIVEMHQLASWLLIETGNCREAREMIEKIGCDIAEDYRRKVVFAPQFKARRMVFICGLHRSGTSLAERWLQAHYQCATLRAKVPENEGQFLQNVYCSELPFGAAQLFICKSFQAGFGG